jgi:hypothetical protein
LLAFSKPFFACLFVQLDLATFADSAKRQSAIADWTVSLTVTLAVFWL